MKDLRTPVALLVAGVSALALAGTAAADPGKSPLPGAPAVAAPSPKAPGAGDLAMLGKLPGGYVQVASSSLSAPAGQQTRGTVSCPIGTVPFSGGEVISSFDLHANVNSSFPYGNGWAVDVNNGSGGTTTFTVYAACAKKPRHYQVIEANGSAPAFAQGTLDAGCPSGTVVLGGGTLSDSYSLAVNVNGTYPDGSWGWRTDSNNATPGAVAVHAYAVCGNAPAGYLTVGGATVTNAAGAETSATASCPGKAVPLGGGALSYTDQTGVNVNSSRPDAHGWATWQNNASAISAGLQVALVCAGG